MAQLGKSLHRSSDVGASSEDHSEQILRLEGSRAEETGGLGLGLAIARNIIQGHGGEIALENRAEGGLRVRVTLPRGS